MNKQQITRSPIDDSIYVTRELADDELINSTLLDACEAQMLWRNTSLQQRAIICHKMVDAFVANKDEIAEQLCWMMGRPIKYAAGEVDGMEERARYMIDVASKALKNINIEETNGFNKYIKRESLGVVFIIAPWNYPYLTAINAIIPAIMSGNSVILKHSAQTPLCAEQLFKAFIRANLPEGVFQFLHLSHTSTENVIKNPIINYVAFTGSVAGGEMVERASVGRFIGLGLELGGKDAAYVRSDADIDYAVETCIDGAFFNSGQSCCGIERIYVDENIFDEFVKKSVALVNQYKLGRSDNTETTLGPVVKASAAEFIRAQIKDAVERGAVAHVDENNFNLNKIGSAYLAPQVLTSVDHSMRVMTEESFGPVVGIMKVKNDDEAIKLINDSEFGLTASVFAADVDSAVEIGEQLEVGTFFVNRCDYLDPALAWVGVKNSGRGCSLSSLGYDSLTRAKSFHIKSKL
ncbi:MAG: acyl-CoA reductase-like NAD-dependent aldehyde dehydrogenase [Polaribacter sp.]|jgi:acyl-CoA reductase-like NAD-dependent aldehyde dehydrogenase